MDSLATPVRSDADLREANRRFFDPLWTAVRLVEPERFNTWPLVSTLVRPRQPRLEVAPGLRPRLPLAGTAFLDSSAPAVAKLAARGAHAVTGRISALPFPDRTFELVCALDVVEHVGDEDRALAELARVAADGATLLLSVPLHPRCWTRFDELVGHGRRYEPDRLVAKLAEHGFRIEWSAAYGMQPASERLVQVGIWFLEHFRRLAIWCYVFLFMPLGLRLQPKLALHRGLIATERVDEIFLVCGKASGSARAVASA